MKLWFFGTLKASCWIVAWYIVLRYGFGWVFIRLGAPFEDPEMTGLIAVMLPLASLLMIISSWDWIYPPLRIERERISRIMAPYWTMKGSIPANVESIGELMRDILNGKDSGFVHLCTTELVNGNKECLAVPVHVELRVTRVIPKEIKHANN